MEMLNEENGVNAANAAAQQMFNDDIAATRRTRNNAQAVQE
jgi:hypothetical protein